MYRKFCYGPVASQKTAEYGQNDDRYAFKEHIVYVINSSQEFDLRTYTKAVCFR